MTSNSFFMSKFARPFAGAEDGSSSRCKLIFWFSAIVVPTSFSRLCADPSTFIEKILSKQKAVEEIASFSRLEKSKDALAFTDDLSVLSGGASSPSSADARASLSRERGTKIRMIFDLKSKTIRKKVLIKRGMADFSFTIELKNKKIPLKSRIEKTCAGDFPVYERAGETFVYFQGKTKQGDVVSKEWIAASSPNIADGSRFIWKLESDSNNYRMVYKKLESGEIGIYRQMKIAGIRAADRQKTRSVIEALKRAFKREVTMKEEELMTKIAPAIYWTASGERKTALYDCPDDETLVVTLREGLESYPLMIDPTLTWGQWLGGDSDDQVLALAIAGSTIYVGGYSSGSTGWEAVTFQGTHSGGEEGYVVAITTGTTPTLVWGQWLGGTGNDRVTSLAIGSDTIYAGGYSAATTNWESVTFQGTHSGGDEGFVVAISTGATPALRWGQWLGGDNTDHVTALALSGNTLYAGGYSLSSTNWESVTFQGAYSGSDEGFVVAITTGTTPTLAWGQWLGGTSQDDVLALAVSGNTVYAGGFSYGSSGWEAVTFQGTDSGTGEGFVVAITTGATPSLAWGQWLGGTNYDEVCALAVGGNKVYAGGDTLNTTSWESVTFQGSFTGFNYEGFVVAITTGATPTLAWGQWVGGDNEDKILALALSGGNLYAAGYSKAATSWEPVTMQGTLTGVVEDGFVVSIATGTTPRLLWGQWLGGDFQDRVNALAASGNNIYAGGYSNKSTTWESVTFQGSFTNSGTFLESFVVGFPEPFTSAARSSFLGVQF